MHQLRHGIKTANTRISYIIKASSAECLAVAVVLCLAQDLLIYALKGLGSWAHLAAQNGIRVPQEIQSFITGATFSTLTNGEPCISSV